MKHAFLTIAIALTSLASIQSANARENCAYSFTHGDESFRQFYPRYSQSGALSFWTPTLCERPAYVFIYDHPEICETADADISQGMGFQQWGTYTCADGESGNWYINVLYVFGDLLRQDRGPSQLFQLHEHNGIIESTVTYL